jgi:hypothetical protein
MSEIPEPIELCLEELTNLERDEPYLRCVAVAGGQPGLCFSPRGEVLWQLNERALAELWVALDGRLVFYRKKTDGIVSLTRASRHLELPLGKPVFVLHGDEIRVENLRYRVHVHGNVKEVLAPERLQLKRARQAVVGATMALGALTAGCQGKPAEGPNHPPNGSVTATAPSATIGGEHRDPPPIDVRDQPPLVAAPPEETAPPPPPEKAPKEQ